MASYSTIINSPLVDFWVHFALKRCLKSQREDSWQTQSRDPRRGFEQRAPHVRTGDERRCDPERHKARQAAERLMNHRTYDGQRYAARPHQPGQCQGLKLAAVPLGGGTGNECSVATPLAETSFMSDSWGVLYKIGTSGDAGSGSWRMGQSRNASGAIAAHLWGNLVITGAGIAAYRRHQQETGKVVPGDLLPGHAGRRSRRPRSPSRTRSSSVPPTATRACATTR
jgi:hypothetical protein